MWNVKFLVSATCRNALSTVSRKSVNDASSGSTVTVPDSILDRSRISLMRFKQIGAGGVDRLGEIGLLGGQVAFGVLALVAGRG